MCYQLDTLRPVLMVETPLEENQIEICLLFKEQEVSF
jgi:hypothetical protein